MTARCAVFDALDTDAFVVGDLTCRDCETQLGEATVKESLEQVKGLLPSGKGRLLGLAERYEEWLLSEALSWATEAEGSRGPVRVVKSYKQL